MKDVHVDQVTKHRLLVVIDESDEVRDLVKAYFRPRGFSVVGFADAGLALLNESGDMSDWDALLTDYHFKSPSKPEFTSKIRRLAPHLPLIPIIPMGLNFVQGQELSVPTPIQFPELLVAIEQELRMKAFGLGDLTPLKKPIAPKESQIVGHAKGFLAALDMAQRVASSTANILISGESGTGKEVFAKFIHRQSRRNLGPYVAINCSAIPESLLESELFGHAKGAFTGADDRRVGLFEEAEDGTIFLDEIGDLSLSLQAKLLRVLQEKEIKRVGENQSRSINCRVICATHKDLTHEVREHRFREDLFFRLNVIPILIPPLRERAEDILPLAEAFLKIYCAENETPLKHFSKPAEEFLLTNSWRGNVRELENVVERAVVLSTQVEISLGSLMPLDGGLGEISAPNMISFNNRSFVMACEERLPTLETVIQCYLEFAIDRNGGARDKTAHQIGIDRKTLYRRLRPEIEAH